MKVRISLNEVIRDFISQFIYTYHKYIEKTDLKSSDITSFNLLNHFNFENIDKLNTFLYLEAPLEIFGHADQLYDGLANKLNLFLIDMEDDGHEVELISREVDKSIPSTLFFLSKLSIRAKNIKFVIKNEDEWGDADILITANPISLSAKPSNKIAVKIKSPYNTESNGDYECDSILEIINNIELRKQILTPITTITYEQL